MSLTIVCWKWNRGLHPKKRMLFGPDHVNTLFSMLRRHVHIPFRLVCITDDPMGLHPEIGKIPLWRDHLNLGGCFVRLKSFSKEMLSVLGPRHCSIDLDCVIVNDITPLLTCKEDFRIWGEETRLTPYCGAFWIANTGCRSQVWEQFQPSKYCQQENGKFKRGTDQAVISDILYPDEATWGKTDGIYNYGQDIRVRPELPAARQERTTLIRNKTHEASNAILQSQYMVKRTLSKTRPPLPESDANRMYQDAKRRAVGKVLLKYRKELDKMNQRIKSCEPYKNNDGKLPANARIVFFNGAEDPNNPILQEECSWIKEHYQ